jgi:hypothetical protein
MDDETATVILSIQLSDVEEAIQNQKGKGSTPGSVEVALTCYGNELRKAQTFISDRRMALSIGRAVLDDGAQLSLAQAEEQRESHNWNLARQFGAHDASPARFDHLSTVLDMDKDVFAQFGHLSIGNSSAILEIYGGLCGISASERGESSSRIRNTNDNQVKHDYVACFDAKSSIDIV